jgi:hypothetical protein
MASMLCEVELPSSTCLGLYFHLLTPTAEVLCADGPLITGITVAVAADGAFVVVGASSRRVVVARGQVVVARWSGRSGSRSGRGGSVVGS